MRFEWVGEAGGRSSCRTFSKKLERNGASVELFSCFVWCVVGFLVEVAGICFYGDGNCSLERETI